jgi:hypothetical protein
MNTVLGYLSAWVSSTNSLRGADDHQYDPKELVENWEWVLSAAEEWLAKQAKFNSEKMNSELEHLR